jgi:nucleotide-binding universal stress UspA family protein
MGEQNLLRPFVEMGKSANVPVESIIKRGEIAATIKKVAFENSVDLMILGVSHGEVVAEWMNAEFIEKTDIPILLIPKWVSAPMKPSPKG